MTDGNETFDEFEEGTSETESDRRRRIREMLYGDEGLTDSDIYDLIADLLDELGYDYESDSFPVPPSAEEVFRDMLNTPAGISGFDRAREAGAKRSAFDTGLERLKSLISEVTGRQRGPQGPAPAVIQEPGIDTLFREVLGIATGPAPEAVFREVFSEVFGGGAEGLAPDPFQQFVESRQRDLESRFSQQVLAEFNQPGYIDNLKNQYVSLEKQADALRLSRSGGVIPSFDDFIRGQVRSNYLSFLAGEKPNLEKAFRLSSPRERGQKTPGQIYQPRRIL